MKIHRLSDNIYALGAGTSADCDFQTRLLESQLELLKLNQDRQVRVATAVRKIQQHLFRLHFPSIEIFSLFMIFFADIKVISVHI